MSGMALETGIEVNLLASETTRFVENPVHDGGRVPLPTVGLPRDEIIDIQRVSPCQ